MKEAKKENEQQQSIGEIIAKWVEERSEEYQDFSDQINKQFVKYGTYSEAFNLIDTRQKNFKRIDEPVLHIREEIILAKLAYHQRKDGKYIKVFQDIEDRINTLGQAKSIVERFNGMIAKKTKEKQSEIKRDPVNYIRKTMEYKISQIKMKNESSKKLVEALSEAIKDQNKLKKLNLIKLSLDIIISSNLYLGTIDKRIKELQRNKSDGRYDMKKVRAQLNRIDAFKTKKEYAKKDVRKELKEKGKELTLSRTISFNGQRLHKNIEAMIDLQKIIEYVFVKQENAEENKKQLHKELKFDPNKNNGQISMVGENGEQFSLQPKTKEALLRTLNKLDYNIATPTETYPYQAHKGDEKIQNPDIFNKIYNAVKFIDEEIGEDNELQELEKVNIMFTEFSIFLADYTSSDLSHLKNEHRGLGEQNYGIYLPVHKFFRQNNARHFISEEQEKKNYSFERGRRLVDLFPNGNSVKIMKKITEQHNDFIHKHKVILVLKYMDHMFSDEQMSKWTRKDKNHIIVQTKEMPRQYDIFCQDSNPTQLDQQLKTFGKTLRPRNKTGKNILREMTKW